MTRHYRPLLLAAILVGCGWSSAQGQSTGSDDKAIVSRGETLFNRRCASCHEPPIEGAPSQADLGNYNPQTVVEILKTGAMQPMAKGLSDADIDAINRYLHAY